MGLFSISAIFLVVPSFSLLYAFELPNKETFSKWNFMLEVKLSELVAAITHIDSARNRYRSDPAVELYKVNGEEILNSVLMKMTDLLQRKKTALRKLVDKAEETVVYFENTYGATFLGLEDVPFFNMKEVSSGQKLTVSSRFRQRVSFDESGVHIPVDIFDGYPEILNGLNWSQSLDDVFKENYEEDPTLRWQYFGSFYGFMRVYPAFRWPDHPSLPDLFDVRRRTWYIQGSVSPMDVIILIDRSGSVHGQTLDIMKITVRALLNSLGENDYVNVAWFNNKVNWVIPCLNTLVQATAQIRRLLSDAVERLNESNLTSYTAALDFAFDAFKKFDRTKKPWAGSNCHKVIMFLSDGGTEWPSDLVTQHCNESRNGQIRIFTFACGPHPIPTVVLKEMACVTGGYFSPITALGSVRIKVQDYVRVLSRPLALSGDNDLYQWHNFYRDIGGLGMMTTVTLPVFNKVTNASNPSNLLGVMGIDVPVDEMVDLFPKHQLGPFGYPFAINTNGFVIFHPRLRDHIVYIEDPPDVDLSDLEGLTKEIEQMRNSMVDGKAGVLKNYESIVPVGLGHAILVKMNYYYDAVESSTFRFGVAVPTNHMSAKIRVSNVDASASMLASMESAILSSWRFCPQGEGEEVLSAAELAERILKNFSLCDSNLVHHLLWDVEKAEKIRDGWKQSTFSGVWSRFLMTSSGLTIVHTSDVADDYLRQRDPLKNNLYKRASYNPGCVMSVARGRSHEVTVACRILFANSFVTAVIGVEMQQDLVQTIFDSVTSSEIDHVSCASSAQLYCYLLNDGGVLIASNRKEARPGDFIGVHDPQLLEGLIEGGMLKREYRYNYQSWCSKETYQIQTMSAPKHGSILSVAYQAFTSFSWNFVYTTLLYFVSSFSLWGQANSAELGLDLGNHSCVTRSAWYYHTGAKAHSGAVMCDMGQRDFRASFLPNVTLILLIAQPPCYNSTPIPLQTLDPQEDVGPDHCSRGQLYRLRPGKCYSEPPKDMYTDCGADSSVIISPQTSVLVIVVLLLILHYLKF